MLVCRLKRSARADVKSNQSEEIGLAKPVSLANGTLSKWVYKMHASLRFLIIKILYALKLTFLGLKLISVLLDLSKESLIPVDSYSKWPEIIPIKSATTGIAINNLCPDFRRSLTVFHLRSLLNTNDRKDDLKRQFLLSQREEIVEEIQFGYQASPSVGIRICLRYRKYLRSLYTTVSSEPKMDKTNIYLDACDFLPSWHPETPETQHNHFPTLYFRKDSRRTQRLNVWINNFRWEVFGREDDNSILTGVSSSP
ncbi:hypothetical protein ACTXT7_005440 [Hymenolepis weldensis]